MRRANNKFWAYFDLWLAWIGFAFALPQTDHPIEIEAIQHPAYCIGQQAMSGPVPETREESVSQYSRKTKCYVTACVKMAL